ncbi:MAG TPA: hypothetical protein VJ814_06715 [Gaiellaceae bacterium]|nr:hypothetical protein [Gaiellaceae bacterium]
MQLVEQWKGIESGLDPRWSDLRLSLRIEAEEARERAAALLGPAGPGLSGNTVRFYVARGGHGIGPEAARRFLGRIDAEGIAGELTLVGSSEAEATPQIARATLAAEWEAALEVLPSDWSDVVAELELDSSADIDRGAVLCAPLNPIQSTGRPGFQLRCASAYGYGASPGMVGRCLERLDDAGITGHVKITRALSDVHPVATQGATFVVGRRPA